MVSAFQYEKWSCLRPLLSEILTFFSNGWGIQRDFQYCLETYTKGNPSLRSQNKPCHKQLYYSTMLSWSKVYLSHKIAVMEIQCLYIKHHGQNTSEHISCEIRKTKKKKSNGHVLWTTLYQQPDNSSYETNGRYSEQCQMTISVKRNNTQIWSFKIMRINMKNEIKKTRI